MTSNLLLFRLRPEGEISIHGFFTAIAIQVFVVGAAYAASGVNSFQFLRISPDARASALAEAVVADGGSAGSLFFNPAALPLIKGAELEAQHLSYVSDISYDYAAFVHGNARSGWGVNAGYLGVGGLTRTVYDPNNVDRFRETGDIQAHDLLVSGGYGLTLAPSWQIGVAVKLFQETLDASTARGGAVDLGLRYELLPNWTLGIALRQLGPSLKFADAAARLPWTGDVGVWTHLFSWLQGGGEVSQAIGEPLDLKVGVEAVPESHVAIRAGYKVHGESNDLGILSNAAFGMGLTVNPVRIDYAFGSLGDFGIIHRISLTWRLRPVS